MMKTNYLIFNCFGSKVGSGDPVNCTEPLVILSEFDSICNPVNIDRSADGPMGELGIDPEKAEERKALRKQLLKEHLEQTKEVAPFLSCFSKAAALILFVETKAVSIPEKSPESIIKATNINV